MLPRTYMFASFAILLLLNACNLNLSRAARTFTATTTLVVLDTLTPTMTFTPTITFTPSQTPTLFYEPTRTPTPQWSACPGIVVTPDKSSAGTTLHILRCEDELQYDLGPFSKGIFAVGPNNKFIIYVTMTGLIYDARIGDRYPRVLVDLKREKLFTTLNKNLDPHFVISFVGEDPVYKLVLVEKRYDQKNVYQLPIGIAQ